MSKAGDLTLKKAKQLLREQYKSNGGDKAFDDEAVCEIQWCLETALDRLRLLEEDCQDLLNGDFNISKE